MIFTAKEKGFTLIELMVTIAIIGIIFGIAVPGYQNYVMRADRSDGIRLMTSMLQAQERFYTDNGSYTNNLTNLGYASAANVASNAGHYSISAGQCTDAGGVLLALTQCVELSAVGQDKQATDGDLTMNSLGQILRTDPDGVEHDLTR